MATLNAYLMFNGNCREAMEFYQGCLGGKLDVMTYGDSPMGVETPAGMKDKVMHSYLESGAISFMASDAPEGEVKHGNTISLTLVGEHKGEIEELFKKLSTGGKIGNPLKEEFFGTYGDLTDKYGFNWMFQFSPNKPA